jgi:uncharacterized membrane protein
VGELNMKKIIGIKWVVFIIMLAALLSPAQAALIVNKVTDEFSLESPYPVENLKACQCSQRADILEIKNIGDFKALYKVEIYSPNQDIITVSDDTFELAPGDSNKVYVYINVPCDQQLNTFYVAKVCTNYGRSKEIYKEIVSKQCQNIKFTSKVMNDKIYPGESVNIKVDVQNVADFSDTFRIIPEAYTDFTIISENEFTLAPDENKTVFINVKYPLSYYGNFEYPFVISTDKGHNTVRGVESFTIEKAYDFSLKTDELDVSACEDVTKEVAVTFSNLAKIPNKYYLHLTGPDFVKLSQDTLSLQGEAQDSIKLIITPKQSDVGEYNIVLSAGTEYGDTFRERSFKLVVNDCYASKATLEGWEGQVTDKACPEQKTFTLNIRNDGLYEEAYEIVVDSPGWIGIREEDAFVRIKPSQNINVPVTLNFPDVDANQTSFILVKQTTAPYQTHEIKIQQQSISQRTCYNIELLQDKYRINYDTPSISMLLQSTGMKGGNYLLKLGELDSRFVYLEENNLSFEPGQIKVLHVYPRNYSDYKQGTYLNKLTLNIKLIDADTGITYDRQFWIVLKDKNFLAKAFDYIANFNYSRIGWCGLVTIILLGLTILLIIVIACLRLKKELKIKRIKASLMKKIKIVNIVLIFLLILSILALILIGSPNTGKFYEEPKKDLLNSTLYHAWKENMPYQIDLAKYFADPDLDALSFTSSQPDHINVKIDGSIVTLIPEHNWAGEEKIVFTANDKKGGLTDSPIMTLHVMKKQPTGPMAYWNTYCVHINIVLLIIIILLVLLILDVVEEKGYTYYLPNKNSRK